MLAPARTGRRDTSSAPMPAVFRGDHSPRHSLSLQHNERRIQVPASSGTPSMFDGGAFTTAASRGPLRRPAAGFDPAFFGGSVAQKPEEPPISWRIGTAGIARNVRRWLLTVGDDQ